MPKRAFKYYIDRTRTLYNNKANPKKNVTQETQPGETDVLDDTEKATNEDAEDEEFAESRPNGDHFPKPRILRVKRFNQNNEIERLLMHSTMKLRVAVDHCDFPSFNQGVWPQSNHDLLRTYPSCAFSVPRPIHASADQCQKDDLCYKRPLNREHHKRRITTSKTLYHRFTNCKKNKAAEKDGNFHRTVFDFAERVQKQPDPFFQGSYDYYYTGGNLCTLSQSGNVVHASGERLQTLEMSEYPIVEHYPTESFLSPIASMQTTENSEVFEIKPMVTSPDISRRNCFVARQRNVISLNYLNNDRQLKVITQFRTKSTPFISFAQSERVQNRLLITTMKQHVRLYDLNNNVPRLVKLYEIEPEALNVSWNTITPWRENTFLYANEYKFSFIDIRTTPDQWMATAISAIGNNFICDHITSIAQSKFNNLFYVGTNHRLHCMDVRHIRKNSFEDPEAVVCRWSHQLQYAPLIIDTCRIRNVEYIALASPLAGDLHVCQLNREKNNEALTIKETQRVPKHIYRSPCLPYQPPTLLEAYEYARLAGKCLQPEANLRDRVKSCTTGLAFSKASNALSDFALAQLLSSNSLGDIFVHTLTKREGEVADSRGNARSNDMLNEFANRLSQRNPPLNYTEIKNMKAMRKVFLCPYLNAELKYDLDAIDDSYSETEAPAPKNAIPIRAPQVKKKRKRLHMGRWQKSFATLHSYKDALVSDLLSIWDIDMEDDNKQTGLDNLQTSLNIKTDPSIKVRNWLDRNLNSDAPMILIPPNVATEYIEPDTTRASECVDALVAAPIDSENNNAFNDTDINLTQNSIDFENAIQSTQVLEKTMQFDSTLMETQLQNITKTSLDKPRTIKKTKKYVKGF